MSEQKKASQEVARLSEIKMLELNIDFVEAQKIVFKENSGLLKEFTEEITGE